MLFYFLLDISQSLIFWVIKNLGYGTYYGMRYLLYGNELTDEEQKDKDTLKLLIEQKEDIEKIKEFIEKINKK